MSRCSYLQAYQRLVESSNLQEKVSGVIRLKVAAWILAPNKTPCKDINLLSM